MLSDITMVFFVYGYPKVLLRCLEYYAKTNMKIIVSDASEIALSEKIIAQVNKHVTYIHTPQTSSAPVDVSNAWGDRIRDATSHIRTPFAVMRSNRRHTLASGLFHARNFLLQNPEYVSVQGHTFNVSKDGSIRPGYYKYHMVDVCEADSSYERMNKGLLFYSPIFYALQRAEIVKKIWEIAPQTGIGSFSELFHATLTLYYGKHKALPCAFCCNLNRPDLPVQNALVNSQDALIASLPNISTQTAKLLDDKDTQLPAALCNAFINYYLYFEECYKILSTPVIKKTFKQHFEKQFDAATFDTLLHVLITERQLVMEDVTANYSASNLESIKECIHFFKDCFVEKLQSVCSGSNSQMQQGE